MATTTVPPAATATAIPDTLSAGLSMWTNPLQAVVDIPSVLQLLVTPGYQMFALGALLLPAVLLYVLLSRSGSGGRR